jgi:4-carboxymuconolactone decarboxylase
MSAAPSERFQRGWERLKEVDAEGGERVIESLRDVAPDRGRHVVEFAFGEIYRRPVLDLRQLVTISALTTLGGAEPQLEVHINAGLNVGLTAREVVEVILQCIPYTGFLRQTQDGYNEASPRGSRIATMLVGHGQARTGVLSVLRRTRTST